MDNGRKLALYAAYYLARYNEVAYRHLEYGNQRETHDSIGRILNVNPHTVKNMRDEFDPLFGHRAGWYQTPLSPSRQKIVAALQYLEEQEILLVVQEILRLGNQPNDPDIQNLLSMVDEAPAGKGVFILRAPTGKKAEEYFQQYYEQHQLPVSGKLIDCRDQGVGYDFKIETSGKDYYVEIKGLSDFVGGVLFTNKEWALALRAKHDFFLGIVSGVGSEPEIKFIQNPASLLKPRKNIIKSVQITWSIPAKDLSSLI